MRLTSFVIALVAVMLLGSGAQGQQWATKMFDSTSHNFGSVARGAKAEYEFTLTNPYMQDVHIRSVSTSCGCTTATIRKPTLKTYESGVIHAKFNSHLFLGKKGATITVHIDRPQRATVRLRVDGYIHSDLILNPKSADLGTVERGSGAERHISVRYAGRYSLRIVGVKSLNPHITAKVAANSGVRPASYDLHVQLDKEAPAGYIKESLVLMTDHHQLKQIPVMVEARVLPEITVTPDTLFLGVLKPGEKITKNVVISGKKPFVIKSIAANHEGAEFATRGIDVAKPMHLVPVTIVAGENPGALVHKITIETDASPDRPELNSYAVVQP